MRPLTSYWISVSDYDKRLGVKHHLIKQGRESVIANGIEDRTLVDKDVDDDGALKVAFIGRASYQKNCIAAIKLMELKGQRMTTLGFIKGITVRLTNNSILLLGI